MDNASGQKYPRDDPRMQIAVGGIHNSEKPIGKCVDHLDQSAHLECGLQVILADAFTTQRNVVHQRS